MCCGSYFAEYHLWISDEFNNRTAQNGIGDMVFKMPVREHFTMKSKMFLPLNSMPFLSFFKKQSKTISPSFFLSFSQKPYKPHKTRIQNIEAKDPKISITNKKAKTKEERWEKVYKNNSELVLCWPATPGNRANLKCGQSVKLHWRELVFPLYMSTNCP